MSNASIRIEQLMLPTYPEPGKEEMPLFSEHRIHQRSTGRPYPNKVVLEVNRERKIERSYTVVHLENEYLDVLVLPEIGGRIFAARDRLRFLLPPACHQARSHRGAWFLDLRRRGVQLALSSPAFRLSALRF